MFEKLPSPYGLVRSGVAPDHPKLKQAILVYDKIAKSPEYDFAGNVAVGIDISVEELLDTHHAIVFACGGTNRSKNWIYQAKIWMAAIQRLNLLDGITVILTSGIETSISPMK